MGVERPPGALLFWNNPGKRPPEQCSHTDAQASEAQSLTSVVVVVFHTHCLLAFWIGGNYVAQSNCWKGGVLIMFN